MADILVTGSSGFLGSTFITQLRQATMSVKGIDKIPGATTDIVSNLNDREFIFELVKRIKPKKIIHLAADIDFNGERGQALFQNNFQSTRNIGDAAEKLGVDRLVFTSSCSIFAGSNGKLFNEEAETCALDDYGKAKIEEEKYLLEKADRLKVCVIRTPMIVGPGRLGMLSILFELIERGNIVWVLGKGDVRHQLVYSQDICNALREMAVAPSGIYNVGSDAVPTFRQMFTELISKSHSQSRILSIPKTPAILALDIARRLKISPIGHYQLRMLTQDFAFDCTKLKNLTPWRPSRSNTEMLAEAYEAYRLTTQTENVSKSTNQSKAALGILAILKYFY